MNSSNGSKRRGQLDDGQEQLAGLRERIGRVDAALIELLHRRFLLVDRLGALKKEAGVPVEDPERERALCAQYESICEQEGFDAETAKRIFHAIFRESKARQRQAR